MKSVDFFHIGPQKSATTWIYNCLKEHPEVACPVTDSIHYYDMFFVRGRKWYLSHFEGIKDNQKLFDPTYTYIRSPWAPRRIAKENPEAKIILCMRNPIERAFSHYWHEKKKGKYNFKFDEVLQNYDLFSSWIEPGFYAEHIERYLQYFPKEQILCQLFDDLQNNTRKFLNELLEFIQVDTNFTPSVMNKKINVAGSKRNFFNKLLSKSSEILGINSMYFSGKKEYFEGVSQETYDILLEICEPEIKRVENLLSIDLSYWRYLHNNVNK